MKSEKIFFHFKKFSKVLQLTNCKPQLLHRESTFWRGIGQTNNPVTKKAIKAMLENGIIGPQVYTTFRNQENTVRSTFRTHTENLFVESEMALSAGS